MRLQINLLTPSPTALTNTPQLSEEIEEFEMSGTWDEVFMLGKHVPRAAIQAYALSKSNPTQPWAALELVHLHATRDHLVLIDPSIIALRPEEEQALRHSVQEVLDYYVSGEVFSIGNTWLFPTQEFASLKTCTVGLAKGRNIDIWMPQDTKVIGIAKKWRQMQNEIQMIWHDHPTNIARYERGELPINSVWMQGIGALEQIRPHPALDMISDIHSQASWLGNLAQLTNKSYHPLELQELHKLGSGNHLIDGRHEINLELWESIWQACVGLLQLGSVKTLHLFSEYENQSIQASLDKSAIRLGFFQSLWQRKGANRFPSWAHVAQKITWQKMAAS